jgi:tetratricopeptide (TPR) repeat protein
MARIAATLAAMPPPKADTTVRLDEGEGQPARSAGAAGGARGGRMRTADTSLNNPYRNDDAFERTRTESGVKLTDRERSGDDMAAGSARVSATLAFTPRPDVGPGRGVCLVSIFAHDCAEMLKAAALLHTDVATVELARGARGAAAVHRSIAGWLLWHLPQEARDDAFVRDWLLAMSTLLLGEGSLSSARRLGEIGLDRSPDDAALLASTARATEALGNLCYGPGGQPVGGDDCADVPLSFDGRHPMREPLRGRELPRQADVLRETEKRLQMLLEERPADSEVRLRLGRALARRGRTEEAGRELAWVVESSRDTSEVALARLLLGRLAEAANDVPRALEHARAALAAAPRSQSARLALASALLAAGDRPGAIEALADLPATPPADDDPWATFLQGKVAAFDPAREALYARVKLP